jgi:hypothetical protein
VCSGVNLNKTSLNQLRQSDLYFYYINIQVDLYGSTWLPEKPDIVSSWAGN